MRKQWVCVLVTLVMLLAMLPTTVSATETKRSGDYEYELVDGDAVLTRYIGESKEIIIPSVIDGCAVVWFGDAFRKSDIVSVTIPEGVRVIPSGAFGGCQSLKEVNFPKGLNSIGSEAFSNCHSLESLLIPEGVTQICDEAFSGCTNLKEITLPESLEQIDRCAFAETAITHLVLPKNLKQLTGSFCENGKLESIEVVSDNPKFCAVDGVLYSKDKTVLHRYPPCKKGTTFTVPDDVVKLDGCAFMDSSLKAIMLPESLTEIDGYVFEKCEELAYIHLPEGLTSIGTEAFKRCRSLVDVCLPSSLTFLGQDAFSRCASLRTVSIPSSITSIQGTFSQCELETVHYAGTATQWDEMYKGAFNDGVEKAAVICESTGNVIQPEEEFVYTVLTDDTASVIAYLGEEKQVTIPAVLGGRNVTVIADGVFTENETVEKVIVPEGVKVIEKAFWGADALQSVVLPSTIQIIKADAFSFCHDLNTIVYNGDRTEWEQVDRETDPFGNDLPENIEICFNGEGASMSVPGDSSSGNVTASNEVNEKSDGFLWIVLMAVVIAVVSVVVIVVMRKRNQK